MEEPRHKVATIHIEGIVQASGTPLTYKKVLLSTNQEHPSSIGLGGSLNHPSILKEFGGLASSVLALEKTTE